MFQIKPLARNILIILLGFGWLVVDSNYYLVTAQTGTVDPLATPQNDPLLPPNNIERELSPLERKRIKAEIQALEIEANARLKQGDGAFTLWFRQLRLYRAIDRVSEIIALGRVGETAWQINRSRKLRFINQRLNRIYEEQKAQNSLTTKVLTYLGTSYQQVRHFDMAISVYNDLLRNSRQADNWQLEQQYLETLGTLYLGKFDYPQAAIIYEELTAINEANIKKNNTEELNQNTDYLQKLIKIYSYTKETEKAIIVKKKLVALYLSRNILEPIAAIKASLGDDYQLLNQIELAINSYQEAVTLGRSWQQIALIGEVLEKLGNIYQQQKQYSLAIQTYEKLLQVETQAYNSYGVINSYDRLGKIYLILEEYQRALMAFNRGLEVARSLNYRVSYFTDLINLVTEKVK